MHHCEKRKWGFDSVFVFGFSGFVEITILILIFLEFFFFLALDMLMGYFCSAILYFSLLIGLE